MSLHEEEEFIEQDVTPENLLRTFLRERMGNLAFVTFLQQSLINGDLSAETISTFPFFNWINHTFTHELHKDISGNFFTNQDIVLFIDLLHVLFNASVQPTDIISWIIDEISTSYYVSSNTNVN